ncbi:hypothetical protein Trydic_g662 [Trypoxylus dichotomus]
MSRSQLLADADHIPTESSEIEHILRTNRFTTNTINRAYHVKTKPMHTATYITKAYFPYIKDQTNRKISVRREEHELAVRAKQITSTLAQHVLMTGHKIDFERTITISSSGHLPPGFIREATDIEKDPNNFNKRDDSQRLSSA